MLLESPHTLNLYAEDETLIVELRGPGLPDSACLADVRAQVRERLANGIYDQVVFQLTGLPVIGTRVLAVLLRLRRDGYRVAIRNAEPMVREVLELTRLDSLFAVSP